MAWQLDFEAGMVSLINADVSVQALTLGNVMPGESHEQLVLPYVVYATSYRRESDLSTGAIAGDGAWIADIEILTWSNAYDEAATIGNDLMELLERHASIIGGINVRHLICSEMVPIQASPQAGVVYFGFQLRLEAVLDIT